MMEEEKFVVTISHQIGSGGAYIGQKLSEYFDIPFVDREILKTVARQLNISEADLEHREERLSSFWEKFNRLQIYTDPIIAMKTGYEPSDRELFELESNCIEKIAQKSSAVILGRAGRTILRGHQRHVAIFVYAKMQERIDHISKLYDTDKDSARKFIETNDRERAAYLRNFTNTDVFDARLYDLCLNTSAVGFDLAAGLAQKCITSKLHLEK